jgi:deazaflavin-dependent oxidoreductase (nitroreductase family)
MRADVEEALAIGAGTPLEQRTIDITTTGRRTGLPRRIEIVFYRFEDAVYLSGIPAPGRRDWLRNLEAEPSFTFHLKHGVEVDLPAVATIVTDPEERRRVLSRFVEEFNERNGPESVWPRAVLEEWVEGSPLARVDFVDGSDR